MPTSSHQRSAAIAVESVPVPALLFCPGDRPERFDKAVAAADAVILDLEDAVAPAAKPRARAAVVDALGRLDAARVIIRINARASEWYTDDVAALADRPDVVVMVPKSERRSDLEDLAPHPVIGLCETAAGVLAASEIAGAGNCIGLMWGSEDLVADLHGRPGRAPTSQYWPSVEFARSATLYAARTAGVTPIDTVQADITDTVMLRDDSNAAVASGFAAKACIHPRQVDVVRQAFAPAEAEIRWAKAVLAAADDGVGVFRFEGHMVDEPVLAHARELLRQSTLVPQEHP